MSKKKSETKEGERNIRCAQLDESERVIGGVQYAGLQKRQIKGSEGSFVINFKRQGNGCKRKQ